MFSKLIIGSLRLGKRVLLSVQSWYQLKLLTEYNKSVDKRESCYEEEKEFKRIANEAYRAVIADAVRRRQRDVNNINDRNREISDTLNKLNGL
jgi:hypothetical protein